MSINPLNLSNAECKPQLVSSVVPMIDATGRNVMVAIAKATWRIDADGLVTGAAPAPVEYVDVHLDDDPQQSMVIPSDLVDFKPSAEVLVVRPRGAVRDMPFAGNTLAVRIGSLSFSGEASETWPFGPVARSHKSRLRYAGTYDDAWRQNRMPLLPLDFNHRYNNAAPAAQIAAGFFAGDEVMAIAGLYGNGDPLSFRLPGMTVLVSGNVRKRYFSEVATLDSILIWSETPALTLIWRHVIRPAQKNAEVGQVTTHLVRLRTARELYG